MTTMQAAGTGADGEVLTIRETAAVLKVCTATVQRWIRDGKLPAARITHQTIRIRRADLEAWYAEQLAAAQGRA
ncbi:MAG: helix-turn-helix domain-containing protein [Anaerolineales bacterium]|nr:helix-turn-helix domain-containing protein [Anaerolineales bacterium]